MFQSEPASTAMEGERENNNLNYLSSIALSPSRSLLLYILLVSLSSLSLYLLSLYHLDDVGRCGWSANLGRRIQTGRAGRDGTGPHQSPAIFDESICWVRPGRVCRFGFVDRHVMGFAASSRRLYSLSPSAGFGLAYYDVDLARAYWRNTIVAMDCSYGRRRQR